MKKLIYLFSFLALASCGGNGETNTTDPEKPKQGEAPQNLEINFHISGQVKGASNQPLVLEALSNKGAIKLAETSTKSDGKFLLEGNIQGMGLYQLKLGGTKIIPLTLNPGDSITLQADYDNFERLPVLAGAEWAPVITEYMRLFNDFAIQQSLQPQDPSQPEDQQVKAFLKLRKPLDAFAARQMEKDPDNPANIVLSTSLTPAVGFDHWDPKNLAILQKVADAYGETYKGSPIAASMDMQVRQIEAGLAEYKAYKEGSAGAAVGAMAPEIALKNPDGKLLKLSSLKGKVVLIDFWASWCGPCRKENPNVVRMYNQYKDKGFTVFSVSLDQDAEAWKRAIKSDGLVWPNHVSDLLQWKSSMPQLYGFQGIPYTVLVDRTGKIIGTNLRGASLEQKLKEVLK